MSSSHASRGQDERIELVLGRTLRVGVVLAALMVLLGALLLLREPGQVAADVRAFHGEPTDLRGARGIWWAAWHLRGPGFIQFGLLILIATPIGRVVFAAIAFARQRDWLYTVIASVVLAALLFGLLGPGH